jgi:hypothetical protein
MVWRTSPALALASASCRLLRAAVPLATLYVGKLIIDALVRAVGSGAIDRSWRWCCWRWRWRSPSIFSRVAPRSPMGCSATASATA